MWLGLGLLQHSDLHPFASVTRSFLDVSLVLGSRPTGPQPRVSS